MTFPKKIRRLIKYNKENNNSRNSLGRKKNSQSKKSQQEIEEKGYSISRDILNEKNLKEFTDLYTEDIKKRKNASIADLKNIFTQRIKTEKIYLINIKSPKKKIIAGATASIKNIKNKKTLILGFQGIEKKDDINHIDYIIKNIFFQLGEKLQIEKYSLGQDRNGYGQIGSNIGLAEHKLRLKFKPYRASPYEEIELPKKITEESLFFSKPKSKEAEITEAHIRKKENSEKKRENYISLLNKRGIETIVHIIK